jgi:tripartite-type tricarboxylate transporter receptor subunit TctC
MNRRTLRRTILLMTAALSLAAGPGLGRAQAPSAYPSKPIRLVVPFPAGTAPDVLARLLAPALNESMAANVVVENLPGAGGTIGVDRVAKAAPDGYTLLLSGDAALVLTGGAYGIKPPYETLRDLAPIAQLVITPNVLVVANDVPARSVAELVALVRSQPGRFSYSSAGIGLSQHRAGELMNSMAGLDMVHVPNPGSPWTDVIAGRTQLMFGNIAVALPLAKDGKVRALAVTSTTRTAAAPDLPTVAESGLPGFESLAWFGLLAPAGTPPAVLKKLEDEAKKALAMPALKERMTAMGAVPGVPDSAAFRQVIQDEIKRWASTSGTATAQRP